MSLFAALICVSVVSMATGSGIGWWAHGVLPDEPAPVVAVAPVVTAPTYGDPEEALKHELHRLPGGLYKANLLIAHTAHLMGQDRQFANYLSDYMLELADVINREARAEASGYAPVEDSASGLRMLDWTPPTATERAKINGQ